jgi:hypothetical protein
MREAGLVGASHRRGGPVTTRRDQEVRPAPDLVDRNFVAEAPNQLWVADITDVPTAAGFLYLAVVLVLREAQDEGLQPPDRRLGHGRSPALGTGARRSGDGRHPAQAARRDPPLGSGVATQVQRVVATPA